MHYEYQTKGTCSSRILFDIEDGKLKNVEYIGGCNGNLQGTGQTGRGHAGRRGHFPSAAGIRCGYKPTSCPDQLATALEQAKAKAAKV